MIRTEPVATRERLERTRRVRDIAETIDTDRPLHLTDEERGAIEETTATLRRLRRRH